MIEDQAFLKKLQGEDADFLRQESVVKDFLEEYEKQRADVLASIETLLETGKMTREEEKYFLLNLRGLVVADIDRVLAGDASVRVEDVQAQCSRLGNLLASRCRPNQEELQEQLRSSEEEILVVRGMLDDLRKDRCARIDELRGVLVESSNEGEIYNATIECEILEGEEGGVVVLEDQERRNAMLHLADQITDDYNVPQEEIPFVARAIVEYFTLQPHNFDYFVGHPEEDELRRDLVGYARRIYREKEGKSQVKSPRPSREMRSKGGFVG